MNTRLERDARQRELCDVQAAMAAGTGTLAEIVDDEITGYGSNCQWSH